MQDIVPLAFPSLLMSFYVSAPGRISARALDAKAEPSNLLYAVELLSRKNCDCLEISHAKSFCEQASNATCFVMSCRRNSCRVKMRHEMQLQPTVEKSSTLCSIRRLRD